MPILLLVWLLPTAVPAAAQPAIPVYADTLGAGFDNYSYGGGSNFANAAPVHAGTASISFAGNNFNAVSFYRNAAPINLPSYPRLRLWLHGGATGGQQITLFLQHQGELAQVALNPYLAGGNPTAGSWQQVDVDLSAVPAFAALGRYDRIDLQSASQGTQGVLYLDDIELLPADNPADTVFRDGFDDAGSPAGNGLTIEHAIAIDGLTGDRFGWHDGAGLPRRATLAHNDGPVGPGGTRGGELREFQYRIGGQTRTVRAISGPTGGFGYVVSHPASKAAANCTGGGDPSSLGHFTPGQFQRVFEGRHHAIFRFNQSYPRYCTAGPPAQQYGLPVTIDWLFATGRDHPLWSITWDMSAIPVDRLRDDARAPYGELRIDGAASDAARAQIAGVAWGDRYRFSTLGSPASLGSSWTWNQPNRIPFVKLWTVGVDATMGLVQTRPIDQQDAGGYWGQDLWNRTSVQAPGCPGSYLMPCDYNWPFQSINYELYGGPTRNARLAWGTNFGFLGQGQYRIRGNAEYGGGGNGTALPGDPMAPGWPRKSYSTWIVLGTHSSGPVEAQIGQADTLQGVALSALVGSVDGSGPAGVADATTVTYEPAGYDHVYGVLRFAAAGNQLDANIAVANGSLARPMLVLRGYTAGLPSQVRLNGQVLVRDQDYFPSPRPDQSQLWLTLNRDLAGATNRIQVLP